MSEFGLLVLVIIGFLLIRFARPRGRDTGQPRARPRSVAQQQAAQRARVARGPEERENRASSRRQAQVASEPSRRQVPSNTDMAAQAHRCWVPPGTALSVAGRLLPDGMIYVGSKLFSVGRGEVEPALIDPSLPVADGVGAADGEGMSYWPSYSEIGPRNRAAYLNWLAGGRVDPGAYIGYVFLFFYGLERRVLHKWESDATGDFPAIAAEVERLLGLYGWNRSFQGYAGRFYEQVLLPRVPSRFAQLVAPTEPLGGDVPASVRVAVGHAATSGEPVSADWAYAWLLSHPLSRLGRAAERCPAEYRRLFMARFASRFADGLKVKGRAAGRRASYQPASAGFRAEQRYSSGDVTASWWPSEVEVALPAGATPNRRIPDEVPAALVKFGEECAADLDAYSRWLGKNPGHEKSVAAAALLPRELFSTDGDSPASVLCARLSEALADRVLVIARGSEILAHWPLGADGKLGKADFLGIAQLLDRMRLGIEPDVRFLGSRFDAEDPVVIYRLGEGASAGASQSYATAALVAQLSAQVAAADGAVSKDEEERLSEHLSTAFHLVPHERTRLRARLHWVAAAKPRGAGGGKEIDALSPESRRGLASHLVGVAAADGTVTREEIRTLERLFKRLELDPALVATELHSIAAGDTVDTDEPVTVLRPQGAPKSFAIPSRPSSVPVEEAAVVLDRRLVDKKLQQTTEVSALLASIFVDTEAPPPAPPPPTTAEVAGLDSAHTALLRELLTNTSWARSDFEKVADRYGVLPEGAIDTLNEAALDRTGQPLIEGDDSLSVDLGIGEEMTG